MEANEKNISPEEGLHLIHTMINTARNKVSEDGFHLLLWGVLVISCCLINYALLVFEYGHWSGFVWMLMPFIGVPVGIIYEKKRAQKGGVRTHYDMHIAYMWWGYGLTLGLLIAFCIYSRISPVPFILLITGLVTYATGKMIQFTPLIIGALIFWVSAILCLWITGIEQLLVEAASIFFGYIVPGFILRRNAKQERHVQTA
jgi:hypothetical protein